MGRRSFYTTFEISQICEVNPTTVQNWVKEKKLKAYATPGGHRRVSREDLAAFMKKFGMPLPAELSKKRPLLLIVDDESEVQQMLASLMESADESIEILCAQAGVEALLMIGDRKPDLLILDIMMPGMNGFDVCAKLKASPATRNVKIVAITGAHDLALGTRILAAGADLFFTKPLNVVEFREKSLKLMRS